MSEYIEREAVLEIINSLNIASSLYAGRKIINLPSADVAPVRHGRWVAKNGRIVCSECDAIIAVAPNNEMQQEILEKSPIAKDERFCYNCGAKMDLEDHHDSD